MIPNPSTPSNPYICSGLPTIADIRTYNDFINSIANSSQTLSSGTIPWNATAPCAIPGTPSVYNFSKDTFNSLNIITCFLESFKAQYDTAIATINTNLTTASNNALCAVSSQPNAYVNLVQSGTIFVATHPWTLVGGNFREFVANFNWPNLSVNTSTCGKNGYFDWKVQVQVVPLGLSTTHRPYVVAYYTDVIIGSTTHTTVSNYTKVTQGTTYSVLGTYTPWMSNITPVTGPLTSVSTKIRVWIYQDDLTNATIVGPELNIAVNAQINGIVHYA